MFRRVSIIIFIININFWQAYAQDEWQRLKNDTSNTATVLNKNKLQFIEQNVDGIDVNDPLFKFLINHSAEVDIIMGNEFYSDWLLGKIADRTEVEPVINDARDNKKPVRWGEVRKRLVKKVPAKVADYWLDNLKPIHFKREKDYASYADALNVQIEKYTLKSKKKDAMTALSLNNSAWDIFILCEKPKQLQQAIKWCDAALEIPHDFSSGILDTKSNLLYKLGKKDEAIAIQKSLLAKADDKTAINDIIQLMQEGKPTWNTGELSD